MMSKDKQKLIQDLEGEIMLAAFHGYKLPSIEKRLMQLYKEVNNDKT